MWATFSRARSTTSSQAEGSFVNIQTENINQTRLSTSLTHDEIVALLGLGVKVQAGLVPSTPGSSTTVTLKQVDGTDQFSADVVVLIDHTASASDVEQSAAPTAPAIHIPAGLGGATAA